MISSEPRRTDKSVPRRTEFGEVKQREISILKTIKEHPNIHHNALKKIIVEELDLVAIKTFDRLIKELIKTYKISFTYENNKKLYSIPNISILQDSQDLIIPYLNSMNEHLKIFEKVYPRLSYYEKVVISEHFVKQLLSNLYGIDLYRQINSDKKIEDYLQIKDDFMKKIRKILEIFSHDSAGGALTSNLLFSIINLNPDQNAEVASLMNSKK